MYGKERSRYRTTPQPGRLNESPDTVHSFAIQPNCAGRPNRPQARFREALLVSDQIADQVSPDKKRSGEWGVEDGEWGEDIISIPPLPIPHSPLPSLLSDYCRYSWRNATSGSTLVARRAGMRHETSATANSSKVIATSVVGSVASTAKGKSDIRRGSAKEAAKPIIAPVTAKAIPRLKTNLITLPVCAPKARRTPISRVRSATVYDITP